MQCIIHSMPIFVRSNRVDVRPCSVIRLSLLYVGRACVGHFLCSVYFFFSSNPQQPVKSKFDTFQEIRNPFILQSFPKTAGHKHQWFSQVFLGSWLHFLFNQHLFPLMLSTSGLYAGAAWPTWEAWMDVVYWLRFNWASLFFLYRVVCNYFADHALTTLSAF